MITLAEWKLIGITLIAYFYLITIICGIISRNITRIKNKARKSKRQQVNHRYAKIDLCEYLTAKMKQEYIGQKKAYINQLVRM